MRNAHSELSSHERYLGKTKVDTKHDDITFGDVLTLLYKGEKDVNEAQRWVFVLNPDYQGKAHLIDLDKINHLMLLQLVTKMREDITPFDFYHRIIKRSFSEYQDAYRTYILTKMHSIQQVSYNGLFSLAPIIKNNIYQTDNVIAVAYDKKEVKIPSNHPIITRIQELSDLYGTYIDVKNKKVTDFINRYKLDKKFVKSYKTDLFQPDIFQLRETIKLGGVFFVPLDSIKVLYASIEI